MPKFKDLSGLRFGRLVVVSRAENHILPSGKPRTEWNCICDCGNKTITQAQGLLNGTIMSCGCYRKEQAATTARNKLQKEIGKKYNKVTIKEIIEPHVQPNGSKKTKVLCQCDCGNVFECQLHSLKSGQTSSCGCNKNISKGELKCIDILNYYKKHYNINYTRQYTIKECRNKNSLQFDFAIFNHNNCLICLIEYQGIQHYVKQPNGFGDYQRDITDKIKRNYCKENNILLYEITYKENIKNRITDIMNEIHADSVPSSQETA